MEREETGNWSLIWSSSLPMSAWQGKNVEEQILMNPERLFYFEKIKVKEVSHFSKRKNVLRKDKAML